MDRLIDHGYEAYVVGGAVRDFLLGRPVHDIDIATAAHPGRVISLFRRTIPTGVKHGTVTVIAHGQTYEVTTFRSESGYSDFRHPNHVRFESSLDKDLMRRDFTINALAMDRSGAIIDLFGGRKDMAERRIRMVGAPEERIHEDPLRIMRGIRFVSELEFTLGDREFAAFQAQAGLLKKISVERLDQEMTRLLAGPAANRAIGLLFATGCFRALPLLKEADLPDPPVALPLLEDDAERWAAFLDGTGVGDVAAFARAWKWSGKLKKRVTAILAFGKIRRAGSWSRMSVYQAGPQCAASVERFLTAGGTFRRDTLENRLKAAGSLWAGLPIHSRSDLAVTGRDLIRWSGRKPGPWLAEVIRTLEKSVVEGAVRNRTEVIKTWFMEQPAAREQKY
ncbi:CCA tRNA nucleotidyltransferase [Sporolactobacillus vineae]|uniref:CCA tRNA nucleotidyltransferase n=1 Tax=Sporolactobacillus vineae TaxID=444463 RepID=UPI000287BED9|nr:CCA tRNA nucleotidyltransferase [Sporolactobacillus vineae]